MKAIRGVSWNSSKRVWTQSDFSNQSISTSMKTWYCQGNLEPYGKPYWMSKLSQDLEWNTRLFNQEVFLITLKQMLIVRRAWDLGPFEAVMQNLHLGIQLGKFWTKRHKGNNTKKLNCHFCSANNKRKAGGKSRVLCKPACFQHRRGVGKPPKPLLCPTPGCTPTLPSLHIKNGTGGCRGSCKQRNKLLVFTASCSQHRSPSKALPEILAWPLVNSYYLGKAKNSGWYQ